MSFSTHAFNDQLLLNFNERRPRPSKLSVSQTPVLIPGAYLDAQHASHLRILDHSAQVAVCDLYGNFIDVNDNFCQTSGYTREELIDKSFELLRHPSTPDSIYAEIGRCVMTGNVWRGEFRNLASNGEAYWVQATIAPVLDKDSMPVRFISVSFDITAQKKVQEELTEAKKKIHTELLDSVTYAARIHRAILPNESKLQALFPESFLISRAQQIVSGDFYWFHRHKGRRVVALGDSTGHGVPAAFISLIAVKTLKNILDHDNMPYPSLVLKRLDESMSHFINPDADIQVSDSADMALFSIDHQLMLCYASARIRIFVLRGEELFDLKGDRFSVGNRFHATMFNAENRTFQLQPGDRVYVMSDGMYDQLGGDRYKRFGSKRMKQLLIDTAHLTMNAQRLAVEEFLSDWRGSEPQTDDMTMIGIRV
jgi:PAS domain S-box-containing protein